MQEKHLKVHHLEEMPSAYRCEVFKVQVVYNI